MLEFLPAVAAIALVAKLIDFVRYARAKDANGVTTQLAVWLAGVGVVVLISQTAWAAGWMIGDLALSDLNFWSQVFYGLSIGSLASIGKDTLKAVDNTNSAKVPTLVKQKKTRTADQG